LFVRCAGCHELLYRREFEDNLRTCVKCNHHARLSAPDRIDMLLDPDTWVEEDAALVPEDPLGFVALDQTYPDYVAKTQQKTGLSEALLSGTGEIEGSAIRLAVCDFGYMGASMGSGVGE
jgi:acetyl-CoA carboxylase carboxyl transferase subunit beta